MTAVVTPAPSATRLQDLDFSIPPGAIVGVVGPNGAGKSTLVKMILGKETPDSGTFTVGDTVKLAVVDQDRDSLDSSRSVFDEITGGSDYLNLGGTEVPARAFTRYVRSCAHALYALYALMRLCAYALIRLCAYPLMHTCAGLRACVGVFTRGYPILTPSAGARPFNYSWFGFKGADQQKKVAALSGGERNRCQLAKVVKSGANVLLLDEVRAGAYEGMKEGRKVACIGARVLPSRAYAFMYFCAPKTLASDPSSTSSVRPLPAPSHHASRPTTWTWTPFGR